MGSYIHGAGGCNAVSAKRLRIAGCVGQEAALCREWGSGRVDGRLAVLAVKARQGGRTASWCRRDVSRSGRVFLLPPVSGLYVGTAGALRRGRIAWQRGYDVHMGSLASTTCQLGTPRPVT